MTRRAASEHQTLATDAAAWASGSAGTHGPGGVVGGRAHPLDVDQHVGAAVLHGLEAADGPAELDPVLGVGHRHLEDPVGGAEHLGRRGRGRPVEQVAGPLGPPETQRPPVVQHQPAHAPRPVHGRLGRGPLGLERSQGEESGSAFGLGEDHHHVGRRGRRRPDRCRPDSVQPPPTSRRAVTAPGRRDQATAPTASPAPSCSIQDSHRLLAQGARELDLPVGQGRGQGHAGEDGAQKRHRGQVAADLLTEHDRLDQAQAETADRLGQFHRQPALLGHGRPQQVVELTGLVSHFTDPRRRGTGRRGGSRPRPAAPAGRQRARNPRTDLTYDPAGQPDGCVMLARRHGPDDHA